MHYRHMTGAVIALALGLLVAQPVSAQRPGNWAWSSQYSTVLGVGDTGDFATGLSWRGVTFDLEKAVSANFAIGGAVGWHVLDDQASGTRFFDQGAITGQAATYVNSVPILLTGTYFAGSRGRTRPFIGAGVGTYWIENRIDAGNYYVEDTNWHFGLMGEAGLLFPRTVGAIELSARFHWAFEAEEIERTYLTFSIGYMVGN